MSPNFDMSNDFRFLTPERVRNRIKNIKYEGDPDLHPIRSTENAFLVRTLYQISLKINELVNNKVKLSYKFIIFFLQYGPVFYRLYHSPSFWGRLSRELLCPPITVYKYTKTIPGSPRVSSNLPPRVSLRFMAGYKFLTYFSIGAFLSWLCGYQVEVFILFIQLIVLVYKSFKAVFGSREPSVRHNYPTEGFGNISFNDSF